MKRIPRRFRKMTLIELALYQTKLINLGYDRSFVKDFQDFWPTCSEWFGTFPDNKIGLNFKNPSKNERWQIYFAGTDDFAFSKSFQYLDGAINCLRDLSKIKLLSIDDLVSIGFERF